MAADLLADEIRSIESSDGVVPEARILALRDAVFALAPQDLSAAASHRPALLRLCEAPRIGQAGRVLLERTLGELSVFLGRPSEADTHYRSAVQLADRLTRPDLFGRTVVGWVHVLGLLGRSEEARRWAAKGRRALEGLGDTQYLGKLAINEGNLAYHDGRFRAAAEFYRSAARYFEESGADAFTRLQVRINEAIALTQLGRIDAARGVFGDAEKEASERGLAYLVAHIRFNRAELERITGRYRDALTDLESASRMFEETGTIDLEASAQRTRSEILLELGLPVDAAAIAAASAGAFRSEGMLQDAGISYVIAARACRITGDLEESDAFLISADECLEGHPHERAEVELERLLLDLERGAAEVARGRLERLVGQGKSLPHFGERLALAGIRLDLDCGRLAEAEDAAQRRIRSRRPLRLSHRIELYRLAGKVAHRSGDVRRAGRRWERAASHLEDYRCLLPNTTLRGAGFGQRLDVYLDLMRVELERSRPRVHRLLGWSESARARLLKDRLVGEARRDFDRLGGERRQLSQLLIRLAEGGRSDPKAARELEMEIARKEEDLAAKLRTLPDVSPAPVSLLGPAKISSALGEGEVCVSYFCLPPGVVAFVLSSRSIECIPLPTPWTEIDESLDRFRFQLDNAAAGGWSRDPGTLPACALDRALRHLYASLLEPLETHLVGATRLLVAPHQRLHQVPFECLFTVEDRLRGLIVSRIPAVHVLPTRRRSLQPIASVTVLGLQNGSFPAIPVEVARVARTCGDPRTGHAAALTRDAVLSALEEHGALHIASHARFREQNPAFSHVLCDDGAVFVDDLDRTRARRDFVFLSACETGRVAGQRGDELVSVAHSFLSAGVRRLVATRWAVDDEATLEFVGKFYEHLWEDPRPDPAAALHATMTAFSASGRHLFDWGGFSSFEA
ncbi:MAG: CHAT domain-containing tetratricopeptide repeat protein [Candidatus Eisenbacteria bacterium]